MASTIRPATGFAAERGRAARQDRKPRVLEDLPDVSWCMGKAAGRLQAETVAEVCRRCFDRHQETPFRTQRIGQRCGNPIQGAEIGQWSKRGDQIVRVWPDLQEGLGIALDQAVVAAATSSPVQHAGRQVKARQGQGLRPQRRREQPGSAAEIEGGGNGAARQRIAV